MDDEESEGVWGYLVPLDAHSGDVLVLRRRAACPTPIAEVGKPSGSEKVPRDTYERQEEDYEDYKEEKGVTASGYLIGRHPECGRCLSSDYAARAAANG